MLSTINNYFIKLNPFTIICYFTFLFTILFSINSISNIFICFVLFVLSIIVYINKKTIKNNLVLFLIIFFTPLLLNYIFTRNLQNSIFSALSLSSFFSLFFLLNHFIDDSKIIYTFHKFIPKTSLVISISLRYNILIIKKYKEIFYTFIANNGDKTSIKQRLKNSSDIFLAVFNVALEDSITLSNSIKSKGYCSKKRTHYASFQFSLNDLFVIFIIIVTMYSNNIFLYIFIPIIYDLIFNLWRIIRCSLA